MGCSSDEPISSDEQPVVTDNIYLEFNKWVYYQMNRQYLWRDDLPDSIDCDFDLAPKDFFSSLISPKDRFSYFTTNPGYSGSSHEASSGFAYQEYSDEVGNKALQVLYVNSINAKKAGLRRGDFVSFRNRTGSSVSLCRVSCCDGIFAETDEFVEFTIDDILGKSNTVLVDSLYIVDNKKIGYLCYLEYGEIDDLEKALQEFVNSNISELILDLRYNPGGYVNTCRYLCNCIIPCQAYGAVFQQCAYNNILTDYYLKTTGNGRTFSYFDTPSTSDKESLGLNIFELNLNRIVIITSSHTASASEATILCLKPYMDVTTIGEQTVGKGVGSWIISDPKFRYAIQPITMRYFNADGETTPDDGIPVDVYVPNGFTTSKKEIGDLDEPLLESAINLITRGISPVMNEAKSYKLEKTLTPIGEPSYVTEFNNKHYNESN